LGFTRESKKLTIKKQLQYNCVTCSFIFMKINCIFTTFCLIFFFSSCEKTEVTADPATITSQKPEGKGILLASVGWGSNGVNYIWNDEYNRIISFQEEIYIYENDLIVESNLNGVVAKAKYNETLDKLLEKSYFKNDKLVGIRIYQWEDDIATRVEYYTFNLKGDTTSKSIRKAGYISGTNNYFEEYEKYKDEGELVDMGKIYDFKYDLGINPLSSLPKEYQVFTYGSLVHENNLKSKVDYKYGVRPIYFEYLNILNEFKYPTQISVRETDEDPDTKDNVITNNYYYTIR
jgi:hypothetical protein